MLEEKEQKLNNFHLTEEYKQQLEDGMKRIHGQFAKKPFKDLNISKNSAIGSNRGGGYYTLEMITMWLQNPASNEQRLRELSNYLYGANPIYRWWVSVLAGMPVWSWTLSIDTASGRKLSASSTEKMYREATKYIDNKKMNDEFAKAFRHALKEDWFFGYERESDNSYSILKLNPDYCRVSTINPDGIYGFQFDFSFFDSKNSVTNNNPVIKSYPLEFQKLYASYQRTGKNWQQLDINYTICLKVNDDLTYGLPYFASSFPSLADIGFYKDLEKNRAEIDNFLMLHQHIPTDEKELDKFAISLPIAIDFDELANSRLPDGVAMFTSPMKVTAVKTERSTSDKNNTNNAIEQSYQGAGLPQQLASSTTSIGLGQAIKANEQIVYRFYRQVENIMNFRLKNKYPSVAYKFRILDITHFNREERSADLLKGAQSGIVPPTHVASAYGSNPYEFINEVDFESNVLKLTDRLRPLKTSYTLTGKETAESGAPPVSETKISDSGQQTRDNESNQNRE